MATNRLRTNLRALDELLDEAKNGHYAIATQNPELIDAIQKTIKQDDQAVMANRENFGLLQRHIEAISAKTESKDAPKKYLADEVADLLVFPDDVKAELKDLNAVLNKINEVFQQKVSQERQEMINDRDKGLRNVRLQAKQHDQQWFNANINNIKEEYKKNENSLDNSELLFKMLFDDLSTMKMDLNDPKVLAELHDKIKLIADEIEYIPGINVEDVNYLRNMQDKLYVLKKKFEEKVTPDAIKQKLMEFKAVFAGSDPVIIAKRLGADPVILAQHGALIKKMDGILASNPDIRQLAKHQKEFAEFAKLVADAPLNILEREDPYHLSHFTGGTAKEAACTNNLSELLTEIQHTLYQVDQAKYVERREQFKKILPEEKGKEKKDPDARLQELLNKLAHDDVVKQKQREFERSDLGKYIDLRKQLLQLGGIDKARDPRVTNILKQKKEMENHPAISNAARTINIKNMNNLELLMLFLPEKEYAPMMRVLSSKLRAQKSLRH